MLTSSSVVLPIAETIATTRLPRLCKTARRLATARIFAGVSRQAPPYFCTMMGLLRILLAEYLESGLHASANELRHAQRQPSSDRQLAQIGPEPDWPPGS